MRRVYRSSLLLLAALWVHAGAAAAQGVERVAASLLQEVMPEADRFERAEGSPPVKRAYRGDELIGYVFLTSDLPPERVGYDAPIRALVGMTPEGVLTGVRVTDYRESRRYEWGDFLSDPWFLGQFVGKHVADRFVVNRDIDGIAQVTISVRALTRGVRDAARRVAVAYVGRPEEERLPLSDTELAGLSWFELREREVAMTLPLRQRGREPLDVSVIHVSSEDLGRHLLGRRYDALAEAIQQRGGADQVVLYAVEGSVFAPPLRDGWSIVQGGDSVALSRDQVVTVGSPGGGALVDEVSQVGALLLDQELVDIAEPLVFVLDRGRPDLGTARVEYTSQAALARIAERTRAGARRVVATATRDAAAAGTEAGPSTDAAARAPTSTPEPPLGSSAAPQSVTPSSPAAPEQIVRFDFTLDDEDDTYGDLVGSASWARVSWVLLVLTLATLAFLTKSVALRWVSLGTTLVVLGWMDGGFLSISHVTGVSRVGSSAILDDLPLLLMVTYTLVTLLVWGRVFCGFLCPFGALQDFLDRLVPRRFKKDLPKGVHRAALKAKYVVLSIILIPAVAGIPISLYQYFEPFGTVFFLSSNLVLWALAVPLLVASVLVPRFYCRYACPLGAALAAGSLLSLRRIPRVEHCDYCKVCEQKCPTGAIEGPRVDFAECVRCNDCEVLFLQRKGVCGHDMEEFRPRLIQVKVRQPAEVGRGP
jgi:NosR/NirI family nitrous oxide reductase transcriptional regulator